MYWLQKFRAAIVFITADEINSYIDTLNYTLYTCNKSELYRIKNNDVVMRLYEQEVGKYCLFTRWPAKCKHFIEPGNYYSYQKPVSKDMMLVHYIQTGEYYLTLFGLDYCVQYSKQNDKIELIASVETLIDVENLFENLWVGLRNDNYYIKID